MFLKGRQARFLAMLVSLWVGVRLAWLWPAAPPPAHDESRGGTQSIAEPGLERDASFLAAAWPDDRERYARAAAPSPAALHLAPKMPGDPAPDPRRRAAPFLVTAPASEDPPAQPPARRPVRASATIPGGAPAFPPAPHSTRAIEAQAYLYVRPGSGRALASGSALGGSQAAARIAVPFAANGGISAAARLYAPLAGKGAEAALGLDWRPLAGVPLRFSIERRQRLDAEGRSAWSAYAAGGFYRAPLPHLILDGYAQAGIVGVHRQDLFVDGALRAEHVMESSSLPPLGLGAGIWGAAQPGAARLDAGPRLSIRLPFADHSATFAVEGRFRLAGDARPGSGVAMTLAAGL